MNIDILLVYGANLHEVLLQNYGKSLSNEEFFPNFINFAVKINFIMKYLVSHFTIQCADGEFMQSAREITAAIAGECGYETFLDTDNGVDGYVQVDFYDKAMVEDSLADFPMEGVSVTFTTDEVEDQDWNETWEQEEGFAPINIDNRLVIYDVLHPELGDGCLVLGDSGLTDSNTPTPNTQHLTPITIGIHARNAFGTGTHETTQMIVGTLLDMDLKDKRVLDCGCGTGILAITALKCGAVDAVAYDIDEWSADNTRHNAEINGVADKIEVFEGNANVLSHISGVFDVVLANINRNILIADMPAFKEVMAHGGTLILSGFYEDDVPLLVEEAENLGLKLEEKRENGEWRMLVFR